MKKSFDMDFLTFLKRNITVENFERLDSALNISKTRKTQILLHPERMRKNEIIQFSKLLGAGTISPTFLIEVFNCGADKLTVHEHLQISEQYPAY